MCPTECRGGLGALPVPLPVPGWALMCRNVSTEICFELLRRGVVGQRGEGEKEGRAQQCVSERCAALLVQDKTLKDRMGSPQSGSCVSGEGGRAGSTTLGVSTRGQPAGGNT